MPRAAILWCFRFIGVMQGMGRWGALVGWLQLSGGGKCCFGALHDWRSFAFVRQGDPESKCSRPPGRRRRARHNCPPQAVSIEGGWACYVTLGSLEEESADNPTEMSNRIDRINDNSAQMDSWLERSLRSIAGCCCINASSEEPPTGLSLSQIMTNSDEGNRQLQQLVLWLENNAIRQWTVEDRKALGDNFDDAFERYLTDLDCPTEYRTRDGSNEDGNENTTWRTNPQTRGKIVFWLVSSAISELYTDQRLMDDNGDKSSSQAEKEADTKPDLNNIIIDKDSFPLGFSTDDANMDGILMALRMKYLLDLRHVQNKVNESVVEMQKLTVKR